MIFDCRLLKRIEQMGRINWKEHIIIDPDAHHGDPCIKGTRIRVTTIVGGLAGGMTPQEIIKAYPQVSAPDIQISLGRVTYSLCVLAMLLLSSACATEGAQTTATRPPVTPTAAAPTLTADRPPTIAATPSTVPATETAGPSTPTPTTATPTPTTRPTFEPLNLPPPLPDWEWHESAAKSYAFMMPQSWEYRPSYHYRTYKSPETATLISVDVHTLPAGADWLEWLRENQERMLPANPLSPELVTPNAILRGRPAFFRHAEAHGGGAPQFVLVADDQDPLIQDRLIRFYLHSVAIPPLAEELQIFRTIIETFVLRDSPDAETTLPPDW
jgi:uncharacterized protein (DUF433 family)